MRLKIIRIVISLLFLSIVLCLGYNQVIQGRYYYLLSLNNSIRVVPLDGQRGRIFDRNGVILADNQISFDVMIIPQELRKKDELFSYLSKTLELDKDKLLKLYRLRYLAPFTPVLIARDIKRETAIILEENKFRYPGLLVWSSIERNYPFNEINAHLLGYVGKISRSRITQLKDYGYTLQDIVGYSGTEEYYDQYLRGEDGGLQLEVNNRGEQVRVLGTKEPTIGQDITLSVDNRLQQIAMESLGGQKGTIVVMNYETGEILGMVSFPSYDPNLFVSGRPEISKYFSDPTAPLLNRAISGQYPPGSAFKVPVAFGALETHKITPHTTFTCPGYYLLGRKQFNCSHVHETQDLIQAIAHSCNVYFFNTGLMLGPEMIIKYARLFGLGERTGIDLPYENKANISDKPRQGKDLRWYKGDILNVSIGQGNILVTPIQLVHMMAMVARDGQDIKPYVLKSIGTNEVEHHPSTHKADINEGIFDIVKEGLRKVVQDPAGTANVLNMEDLPIFGKTGTAQTSGGRPTHAWFVGYCPTAKTKIVFCIFLEYGGSSYNACVAGKNMLLRMKEEGMI